VCCFRLQNKMSAQFATRVMPILVVMVLAIAGSGVEVFAAAGGELEVPYNLSGDAGPVELQTTGSNSQMSILYPAVFVLLLLVFSLLFSLGQGSNSSRHSNDSWMPPPDSL